VLRLWQLFVEWVFSRARDSAAVHVQTSLLLSYADCAAALEQRAKELDAQGLQEQAGELRRQLQALSPATVSSLLALPEPSANGSGHAALPEPARRLGRPPKIQPSERSEP
jgi:hypothetical protein